jgi:hypothetical protein
MIAPTPVLHLLQRSSHASTFLPRFNVPHMLQHSSHASTLLTCFNVPHMLQRSSHASTFLTCFNIPPTLQRSSHASTFLTCFNVPHMFQQSVLHLLQRSAHASHGLHLLQQSTSERGLSILHTRLALTRVNVLLLVMFVYLSINSIAASHISLAFNSVFFGYIS